uniref:Uncharacterized protein n=1 Tax=Daucus carota subsp. sativus TaxID=79200 RepID=A0A166GRY2_DAUCS
MASPMHRHARSSSLVRKPNTKEAAQRLAMFMSNKSGGGGSGDESSEDDDLDLLDYDPSNASSFRLGAGGRAARPSSPMAVRPSSPLSVRASSTEHAPLRSLAHRISKPVNFEEQQSSSSESSRASKPVSTKVDQRPASARSLRGHLPQSANLVEQQNSAGNMETESVDYSEEEASPLGSSQVPQDFKKQNSSARLHSPSRSSRAHSIDQPQSTRSSISSRTSQAPTTGEQNHPLSARSGSGGRAFPFSASLEQLSSDHSALSTRPSSGVKNAHIIPSSVSVSLGPTHSGITGEHRSISRKANSFVLQKRKLMNRKKGPDNLRNRQSAREAATSAFQQLKDVASELSSLKTMTQRSMLTQEEMEEVVLKRCWLAHYWGLCIKLGVRSEIAAARHEYWSSLAPLPDEVVLAAGQMAKDEDSLGLLQWQSSKSICTLLLAKAGAHLSSSHLLYKHSAENNDLKERSEISQDVNEFLGDANIENMLLVEKGLRELTSLQIENSLALAMAHQRPRDSLKSCLTDEVELPEEGKKETIDLGEEELDDVLFKQAWLAYFWRRAKNHGLEPDIADERLIYWINQDTEVPATSQDAVDAERGLMELWKLGIETQLWEESRKIIDHDPKVKLQMDSSF